MAGRLGVRPDQLDVNSTLSIDNSLATKRAGISPVCALMPAILRIAGAIAMSTPQLACRSKAGEPNQFTRRGHTHEDKA